MHDPRDDFDAPPQERPPSRRQAIAVALIAIAFAYLPFALAWTVLEWPPAAQEPESWEWTPNPKKAPFISRAAENMTFVSPPLASISQYWSPVLWIGTVIWGLAAATFFGARTSPRFIVGPPQIVALAALSIFIGLFLAWPWIAVFALDLWR